MKEIKFEIPVAGVYKHRGLFPDDMTDKEAMELVISQYNSSDGNMKLYQRMIDGEGVKFPMTFAKVVE